MKGRQGYTLLEVVISILITALTVGAVFSVAITTKRTGGKEDRRLVAQQASRQVTNTLKSYVTGDWTTAGASAIPGPSGGTGPASWSLNGLANAYGGTISDAVTPTPNGAVYPGPSYYALAPGTHTLTGFLPSWFEGAPYNARVTYYVSDTVIVAGPNGNQPWVSVSVNWTEL